jgi:hypothetical protein
MAKVTFVGQVHPACVELTLPARSFRIDPAFDGLAVTFEIRVEHNSLFVTAEAKTDDPEFGVGVYWRAFELAIAICDLECLEKGVAFFPTIEKTVAEDGTVSVTALADRTLADRMSVFQSFPLEDLAELIIGDTNIKAAVNDLAMMLRLPNYAPIAAGRALDAIVHIISGGYTAKDWERMREVLLIGRNFIQPISDTATPHRHGNRVTVSAEINRRNADRAWDIMNRLLILKMSGGQKLGPGDYELLE